MASKFKIALVQLAVGDSKGDNIARAVSLVKQAASAGASLVVLPEYFSSPIGANYLFKYAETIPGTTTDTLASIAKENNIFLVGGSIPEKAADGKLYNTSTIYNFEGKIVAIHRKRKYTLFPVTSGNSDCCTCLVMLVCESSVVVNLSVKRVAIHLFDINVPGKIRFQESEVLSPGKSLTCFNMPNCRVGVGICYDIRFAEMAQLYAQKGCNLLVYPGAFNMTTGPAHWEALQKGRALDNQVYVATVSRARDKSASYVAWGHSTVVSPWGEIIATAGHEEAVIYAEIDMDRVEEVRTMIPLRNQHRRDLYQVADVTEETQHGDGK